MPSFPLTRAAPHRPDRGESGCAAGHDGEPADCATPLLRQGYGGQARVICDVAHRRCGPLAPGMKILADIMVGLVAVLHLNFLVLEMFLWTKPYGRRVFGLTPEKAEATRALAANQGLYNGFLAAGLAWGLYAGADGYPLKVFFLGCIIVAGIFGAATASRKILWVQAVPAAVALALVCATWACS